MTAPSHVTFISTESSSSSGPSTAWDSASLRSEVDFWTASRSTSASSLNRTLDADTWRYPPEVRVATTVAVSCVCGVAVLLNILLALTIQFSPSLKTPPNSHLLNICCNNFALSLHMLMALPSLHLNGSHVQHKGSEILSGLQLFLLMHCLFQYWCAFASIGYYRFKTIRKPSLSLRVRKLLVSRSITITWVISLLVAITFSLTTSVYSAYLPFTLDPFRAAYLLKPPPTADAAPSRTGEESLYKDRYEQVVVMSLVLGGLIVGLVIIVKSYYNICRTLNLSGSVGKNRVSPWPAYSSSSPVTSSEQRTGGFELTPPTVPGGRAYRPNAGGLPFCVSGSPTSEESQWIVHYQKCDHCVFIEDILTLDKAHNGKNSNSDSHKRCLYAGQRPLTATFSNGSTASVGKTSATSNTSNTSGIRTALSKQTVRRERGSLNSASKNSLAMLVAFLLCSLPLIVCQVPGILSDVAPERRIVVLLVCRVLFFLNAPVYPMWYLLFSHRVKKCLTRMCEALLIRLHFRQ
ncbi:uncharacterized protein LOC112562230 isoform X2 [Pomacea canaliculata]|uniref:uncharacterized protein LOC112562230 isoform X2 n=1 Tax=Pomacea canaliculata TaxID=400727 RepID=UPI000D72FB4B|nr:uncharacterized protein LOC112562230 isoform X2 [Pomacea canaliculata]